MNSILSNLRYKIRNRIVVLLLQNPWHMEAISILHPYMLHLKGGQGLTIT